MKAHSPAHWHASIVAEGLPDLTGWRAAAACARPGAGARPAGTGTAPRSSAGGGALAGDAAPAVGRAAPVADAATLHGAARCAPLACP